MPGMQGYLTETGGVKRGSRLLCRLCCARCTVYAEGVGDALYLGRCIKALNGLHMLSGKSAQDLWLYGQQFCSCRGFCRVLAPYVVRLPAQGTFLSDKIYAGIYLPQGTPVK